MDKPADSRNKRDLLIGSRRGIADKRSNWTFKCLPDSWWVWHVARPDGSQQLSNQRFLTRTECVADATLYGYVAWIPEAERRVRQ
jgi:hypothetical protein